MSTLELDDVFEDETDDSDVEKIDVKAKSFDTRRKIEDMLERKRLREEFGDCDF